jgi:mono/diheme cytochrome c family protein
MFAGIAALVGMTWCASSALALPFNQDMALGQNMVAGSIMRPKEQESVPMGSLARRVPSREVARTWVSPNKSDKLSIANGERLFAVNCSPCHGNYSSEQPNYIPGPVSWAVPGPDLSADYIKVKPDGHFFEFIHFGGMAIMPAYGYKLSIAEHWDIVNYMRTFQGISKPAA